MNNTILTKHIRRYYTHTYVQFSSKWRQNPKSRFENFFSSTLSAHAFSCLL